jgi:hypothetical protein
MSYDERTGCWNWTGARIATGYGVMQYMGKRQSVHRVSAMLYLGLKPESKLLVLHRCDNPSCFNPKHLFLGTNLDNNLDCVNKGRHRNAVKTHCFRGHALTGHNLIATVRKSGRLRRSCRTCKNSLDRRYGNERT